MCGIAGFISDRQNKDLIESITNSMAHRGPDAIQTSIYKIGDNYLHLGSSRLSITGLDDGDMPMEDNNGNVIIYNGEIYELESLRSKYSLNLSSKSDTRHLLNILSSQNINEIKNLNGMFSFAYFEKSSQKLLIGRDRLGIKPLYFGSNNKFKFYFSSEIKPLFINNIIENKLNENSINNYLYLGGINSLDALFTEVKTQTPGSLTEFKNNKLTSSTYREWTALTPLNGASRTNDFHNLFSDALNDQLNAEVPVNLLFSGGIDSSLIALYAKKYLKRDVTAYSLGYENNFYDETKKAEQVTKNLEVDFVKFNFPNEKNEEIIDEVIHKLPEPIADPSIIPSYYLAKKVSKYTKVVITGDGADELFGGYEWYRGALISKYTPKVVSPLLNLLSKINVGQNDHISSQDRVKLFSLGNSLPIPLKILLWQNYIPSEKLEKQIKIYENYINKLGFNENFDFNDLRKLDIKNYLYSNILKKSDISSMLNSLEIRPVFLDDRIVDFALNSENRNNFNILETKTFLKSILRSELKNYNFKKKHGFSHDFGEWTTNVGLKYLENNWMEIEEVHRFISNIKKDDQNKYFLSRHVWKFYSLFKWIEVNKVRI